MSDTSAADAFLSAIGDGPAVRGRDQQPRYALTELGLADRFEDRYSDLFRYCRDWNTWLTYDGARWVEDRKGAAEDAAQSIPQDIHEEAARETDSERRKEVGRFALKSETSRAVRATLELARSRPVFAVTPEDFDQHSHLLNVANGTINLISGQLRPHDPADLITKVAPTVCDPAATCDRFTRFLEEALVDPKLIAWVQRYFGYCLTGSVSEQILTILYGSGANGKSVLVDVIGHVLGEYAQHARPEILLPSRAGTSNEGEANLKGARLVFTSETGARSQFDEAKVKRLTGGDAIRAARKYGHEFEFSPTHKLVLQTNHKPRIEGTDYAIWRRIRLVPFEQTFRGPDADPALPDRLRQEASGILNWLIEGCLMWQEDGLEPPDIVLAATEAYRSESDVLGAFIDECCETDSSLPAAASSLYRAYTDWCHENGESAENQRRFSQRMQERGFDKKRTAAGVMYQGIGLKLSPNATSSVG